MKRWETVKVRERGGKCERVRREREKEKSERQSGKEG